ncbi:uncharacterized protein LOC125683792 isoform X2 [Ostrea edulis]|uniref:uncharacterized protein LOC125683792 isoform X2 n=1 Tax=Ostrea edulis TaxID=37623 RepID=UPI0024AE8BD8|nr:uncharacterized protein LOC125683792 isoform X2 [Ostrea edulis]
MSRFLFISVVLFLGYSYAAVLRNQKDENKLNEKVQGLDAKISQLRDLLNDIKNENNRKGSSDSVQTKSVVKEADMTPPKLPEKTNLPTPPSLSPEEIAVLKKLKTALENEMKGKDQNLEAFEESVKTEKAPAQLGNFLDQPLPEKAVEESDQLKQLASLMSQRSNTEHKDERGGFGRIKEAENTVEAHRNTFRENLLNVLVDKLLEDTDTVLEKGFSLEDVLRVLTEKAKMEKERNALEQTLTKLLDEVNI